MNTMHNRPLHSPFQSRTAALLIAACAALFWNHVASATSIGLKLGQTSGSDRQNVGGTNTVCVQPDQSAGAPGYAQINWNILGQKGNNGTNSFGTNAYALFDSGGNNTRVSIQWDAAAVYTLQGGSGPTAQGTPDKNLMNPYVRSTSQTPNVPLTNSLPTGIFGQSSANKPLVYVYGLKPWLEAQGATQYDVVIYTDNDVNTGRTAEFWLANASGPTNNIIFGGDITTHVFVRDYSTFTTTPVYQQVPLSSQNGQVAGSGNYAVFTGVSADSFLLRTEEYFERATISAVQIVARATPVGATIDPLPTSQTYAGKTAQFNANVGGVLPFGCQWQKNGTNLSNGGNVSGATSATLKLTGVGAGDAGSYSLVVSNAGGWATSSVAPLVVTAPEGNSYAERVATNNAAAYWRFNEIGDASTNNSPACDLVGGFNAIYGSLALNGYNGVAGPQPPDFPGFESPNWGLQTANSTATSLPYPSAYIRWAMAPALNLNTNTVTLCAWVYPASAVQSANSGLIYARGSGRDVSGLSYGANNNLRYEWNSETNTYNWISGLVVPSNIWSLVACVITPSNAALYVMNANGTQIATNPVAHTNALLAGRTMIGDDANSSSVPQNRGFNGVIDEAAVFARSLSAYDIQGLYKKALGLNVVPTQIGTQPQPLSLIQGRTARFSVGASGDGAVSYQWRKNGGNLSNGGTISGATSANLTISPVAASDPGTYDVVVTAGGGPLTSSPASLEVIVPVAGSYVAAANTANPAVYYRFSELTDTASGTATAYDIIGGNNGTFGNSVLNGYYGIPGPKPTDGFVAFESTNTAIQPTASVPNAYVTVPPLGFTTNKLTITAWIYPFYSPTVRAGIVMARAGQPATGLTFLDSAPGTLSYQWNQEAATFNWNSGLVVPNNQWSFVAMVVTPTDATLYLINANGAQTAVNPVSHGLRTFTDTIRIGGDPSSDSRNFDGYVDEVAIFSRSLAGPEISDLYTAGAQTLPVTITGQPQAKNLIAGHPASFSVTAMGNSPLSYQWRKDGGNLSNGGLISGATSATLGISAVSVPDAGGYDVVVTGWSGSVTSSPAALTVAESYGAGPILVDFGPNDGSSGFITVSPDYLGQYWNNMVGGGGGNGVPTGTSLANLVTVSNYITYVGLTVGSGFAGNGGSSAPGLLEPSFALLGNLAVTNATLDYFFAAATTGTMSLSNLNTNSLYAFRIFGSRNVASTRVTRYTVTGRNGAFITDLQTSGASMGEGGYDGNNNTIAAISGVSPDATGRIQVAVSPQAGGYGYINTMEITESPAVVLTIEKSGGSVVLSWPAGTLLEASAINGTWTTNNATSPFTNTPSGQQKLYRVIVR